MGLVHLGQPKGQTFSLHLGHGLWCVPQMGFGRVLFFLQSILSLSFFFSSFFSFSLLAFSFLFRFILFSFLAHHHYPAIPFTVIFFFNSGTLSQLIAPLSSLLTLTCTTSTLHSLDTISQRLHPFRTPSLSASQLNHTTPQSSL